MSTFRDALRDSMRQRHITRAFGKAITEAEVKMPTGLLVNARGLKPVEIMGGMLTNIVHIVRASSPPEHWDDVAKVLGDEFKKALEETA